MKSLHAGSAMMRLLCLLTALAGSPLRQAEAAEDFAHSLGELGQAYSIEEKDGGVGDDQGSTIIRASTSTASAEAGAWLTVDATSLALAAGPSVRVFDGRSLAIPRGSGPASASKRFAWLQRFLF
jgi:hypothetical protein